MTPVLAHGPVPARESDTIMTKHLSDDEVVTTRTEGARPTRTASTSPSWRATFLGADTHDTAGGISWGAVLAGVVTFLALLVTFSFVGAAVGLGQVEATSDQPFAGVGTGLAIWGVLTLLISLAAAGFVTGVLSIRGGFMHGVVTWATGLLAVVVMLGVLTSSVFGAIGSVVGSTASVVGSGAASVADLAGDGIQSAVDGVSGQLEGADLSGLDEQTQEILEGTGVEELQPDYLQGQLDAALGDVQDVGTTILTDPDQADTALEELGTSLEERATTISEAVDRDAIAQSVEENTDLTGQEAEEAVDSTEQALTEATETAQEQLQNAQTALEDGREQIDQTIADARQTADDAASASARAAAWVFVGLLLGLAVTAFASLFGSRLVVGRSTDGEVRTRR